MITQSFAGSVDTIHTLQGAVIAGFGGLYYLGHVDTSGSGVMVNGTGGVAADSWSLGFVTARFIFICERFVASDVLLQEVLRAAFLSEPQLITSLAITDLKSPQLPYPEYLICLEGGGTLNGDLDMVDTRSAFLGSHVEKAFQLFVEAVW